MTLWDFIDKHPVLTFFLIVVVAGCVPSFTFKHVTKTTKGNVDD